MLSQTIAALPLFASAPKEAIEEIASFCAVRRYAEGTLLFYEEEAARQFYLLIGGEIRVYKSDRLGNEIFLYFLHPGDPVTEFESFARPACYANLAFSAPSEMLVIEADRFRALMRRESILMESLMNALLDKTARLHCALNRETVFDTTAKVAHFIHHHQEEFNRLKKQEVAARLNIQPETLSRVLRKLVRDKIILQAGDKIVVPDVKQLESIYR
ncbi:MAG: Crp/Fnr family transcriptional regulator [Campylobacterales bacterium]